MLEFVGYIGAALTTTSFVPQALRTLKTGDTKSISLSMYALFTVGTACWIIYGIALGSVPIIVSSVITCGLSLVIALMKLRHG